MDYFVRIEDPKGLRVAIMSAARDSLLMQTALEELQSIRKSKLVLLNCAKEDFRQITNLCKKLSETIADDKARKEVLNSFKAKEEAHENQILLRRDIRPDVKQEAKPVVREEAKPRLGRGIIKPTVSKPAALKPVPKNTLDMLPEIKEDDLPMVAPPTRLQPSAQAKTEADRLEYTLAQIEKKLADLQK